MATKVTQVFKNRESIGDFTQVSQGNFQLGLSTITIGALQYTTDTVKTLDLSTSGLGGLDSGSLSGDSTYKVFAVAVSGDIGLVASTGSAPTGYTSYIDLGHEIKTDHKGWNFIRQDVDSSQIRNLIHNGAFDHFQRTSAINPLTDQSYVADRFRPSSVGAGWSLNMRNSTYDSVTNLFPSNVPEELHGISRRSLAFTTNSTKVPTGGGEFWSLIQGVESNFFDLYGKKAVFSFWIQSNHSATYSVTIGNWGTNTYREHKSFSVVPGWQRINMVFEFPTISEVDWQATNDAAIFTGLCFSTADRAVADNTRQIEPAGGLSDFGTIGQSNLFDTVGNEIRINGVMMYEFKGDFVDFKRAGADVSEELQLCKRYYYKWQRQVETAERGSSYAATHSGIAYGWGIDHPVEMRAAPTITISGSLAIHRPGSYLDTLSSVSIGSSVFGWSVLGNHVNRGTADGFLQPRNSGDQVNLNADF
jgi:hypothetical protein